MATHRGVHKPGRVLLVRDPRGRGTSILRGIERDRAMDWDTDRCFGTDSDANHSHKLH